MILEYIPISNLDVQRFNLNEIFNLQKVKKRSLSLPLIAIHSDENKHYLIYGFEKVLFHTNSKVLVLLLDSQTTITNIIEIILELYSFEILSSPITKAKFISCLISWGVPEDVIVKKYFEALGFEKNSKILEYVSIINKFDKELLSFFHEKRYSLKQCVFLFQYGEINLKFLLSLKNRLNLTASIFEELVENFSEVLLRLNISPQEFFKLYDLENKLSSFKSLQERTEFLRNFLKSKRSPFLTTINNKLKACSENLNFECNWDRSLEDNNLKITFSFSNLKDFNKSISVLNNPKTISTIEEMLNVLHINSL